MLNRHVVLSQDHLNQNFFRLRLRARIEGSSYKNVTGHLFHSEFSLQDGIISKPTITCLELHKTQKTLLGWSSEPNPRTFPIKITYYIKIIRRVIVKVHSSTNKEKNISIN